MANWGLMQGLGQGMQQWGGSKMDAENRKADRLADEASYQKKLDAAEKARAVREQADRDRQAVLDKTERHGAPQLYEKNGQPYEQFVNKFGDVIEDRLASPAAAQGFLATRKEKEAAKKAEADKIAREEARFNRGEAGKDRRANMTDARIRETPRGASPEAKPQRMQFQKVTDANGVEHVNGYDPVTGELRTIDGKLVASGKTKSSFSALWD